MRETDRTYATENRLKVIDFQHVAVQLDHMLLQVTKPVGKGATLI